MKLSMTVLAAALGLSSARKFHGKRKTVTPKASIGATSKTGQKMLSKARRLEQDENEEIDFTWVANMALKFQGCYHTQAWNDEADGEEDIRISTQRLVRFRLCPADACEMESAAGCSSGYGDYIIGMEEYLEAYFEAVEQDQEYNCEYEAREGGDCECDDENQGDDFDEEICQYDCYMGKGMEYCVDRNPYQEEGEEEEEEEMELREMAECREVEVDNGRRRKLEQEEVQYFMGAYCSESGSSIHLGVFTEETCSQFADEYGGREMYYSLTGKELPYGESTMIGSECMSCKEPQDVDQNNQNDQEDEDEVKESCEQLYEAAGKCEANLASTGYVQYPNNYGCNFMEGIKIVRKNGAIVRGPGSKNTTASIFIGLFACSFVLLGGYAYYLKTKLDRSKVDLVSDE